MAQTGPMAQPGRFVNPIATRTCRTWRGDVPTSAGGLTCLLHVLGEIAPGKNDLIRKRLKPADSAGPFCATNHSSSRLRPFFWLSCDTGHSITGPRKFRGLTTGPNRPGAKYTSVGREANILGGAFGHGDPNVSSGQHARGHGNHSPRAWP